LTLVSAAAPLGRPQPFLKRPEQLWSGQTTIWDRVTPKNNRRQPAGAPQFIQHEHFAQQQA
jgi:hypothetical protein